MAPLPDLPDMVRQVTRRAAAEDPLSRLAAAVQLANELGALADEVVDQFVADARDGGYSWAQIGGVLGVSKQAAQQQFVEPLRTVPDPEGMERATPRARQTMRRAIRAAKAAGSTYVGTEHLLLGLIDLGEGIGPDILAAIRPLDEWHTLVTAVAPSSSRRARGRLPFTPLAGKALGRSIEEAVKLGHNYVGTEHQLLALVSVEEGLASKVLVEGGATYDQVRSEVVKALSRLG